MITILNNMNTTDRVLIITPFLKMILDFRVSPLSNVLATATFMLFHPFR